VNEVRPAVRRNDFPRRSQEADTTRRRLLPHPSSRTGVKTPRTPRPASQFIVRRRLYYNDSGAALREIQQRGEARELAWRRGLAEEVCVRPLRVCP
jgi:hypothetical protein